MDERHCAHESTSEAGLSGNMCRIALKFGGDEEWCAILMGRRLCIEPR